MRLSLAFLIISLVSVRAGEVTFTSGPKHVTLIELFTSEGCSSCPPAERWLSERGASEDLWRTFVPVSWHVDYWNRLGWPDRFSSREFTQRQYDYVAAWHADTVYTPCFVRDGREWRPSAHVALADAESGVLTIHYDGHAVRGSFASTDHSAPNLELYVALLGAGIQSNVTAGENRGSTLHHDFVVLQLAHGPVTSAIPLMLKPVVGVPRLALAAWVTTRGTAVPLQATGGWLAADL